MAIELDRVTSPTPPLAFAIFVQKICSLKTNSSIKQPIHNLTKSVTFSVDFITCKL